MCRRCRTGPVSWADWPRSAAWSNRLTGSPRPRFRCSSWGNRERAKKSWLGTLHRMSRRAREPFVVVDCPVLDDAYIGQDDALPGPRFDDFLAWAGSGTIFIDHLLSLTPFQQAQLLKLADTALNWSGRAEPPAAIAPRIIAASPSRLDDLAPSVSFRADLADTLSIYPIEVPPLRDRVEDIPLLARERVVAPGRLDRASLATESSRDITASGPGIPGQHTGARVRRGTGGVRRCRRRTAAR